MSEYMAMLVDTPEIDPYDLKAGKGFMAPNSIIKESELSANAKLAYVRTTKAG